jgi:hypothetical protein
MSRRQAGIRAPYQFCTQFDRRYLAHGIVLYRSLAAHCDAFELRVFCMDETAKAALDSLALPHLTAISLQELEEHDPGLASVKGTRSLLEYYWTATPSICLFALDRDPEIDHIVHIDADLEFYASPSTLFDDLGEGSILLIPHREAAEFTESPDGSDESGGRFNVQFEIFRRDENSVEALRWWRERCLEWCYDRYEPGRHGDQKYLDDWPERFSGVRVCSHPGAGLAAWNISRHRIVRDQEGVTIDGAPLIFHHFSSLEVHHADAPRSRLASGRAAYRVVREPVGLVWTAGWRLTDSDLSLLWEPYVRALSKALGDLRNVVDLELVCPPPPALRRIAFNSARRIIPTRIRASARRAQRGWWALVARWRKITGMTPPPPAPPSPR